MKIDSFFPEPAGTVLRWGNALSPGHEADQRQGSKLQEPFCHAKNPDNGGNVMLRDMETQSVLDLT